MVHNPPGEQKLTSLDAGACGVNIGIGVDAGGIGIDVVTWCPSLVIHPASKDWQWWLAVMRC